MTGNYIIFLFLLFLLIPGRFKGTFLLNPETDECLTCHGDLIENPVIHPELEFACDICHSPTGEEHPKDDAKGFSLTEEVPSLCFNCHSDFQNNFTSFQFVHGPVKDTLSCLGCHNPHSSPYENLLNNNVNDMCLQCHSKTIVNDSTQIRNIGRVLTIGKSIHKAIDGGCVTCHNPHFSELRALLTVYFPTEQYVTATTDKFELCFLCHDTELLETKSTESGTNFRNGKINLHFVHVNREKGRGCLLCHDIHGSKNDRLIADKVKFGRWEMRIRFELTTNGGSCLTACHNEKMYDRSLINEEFQSDLR